MRLEQRLVSAYPSCMNTPHAKRLAAELGEPTVVHEVSTLERSHLCTQVAISFKPGTVAADALEPRRFLETSLCS